MKNLVVYYLLLILSLDVYSYEWERKAPNPTNNKLNKIEKNSFNSDLYAIGEQTTIIKSIDNGVNWTVLDLTNFPVRTLIDIEIISENAAFVLATDGTIFISNDGGQNWDFHHPGFAIDGRNFNFIDSDTGYLAAGQEGILKTENSGVTWSNIFEDVPYKFTDVQFLGDLGFAVGGKHQYQDYEEIFTGVIYKTTDGGNNWIKIFEETNNFFYCIELISDDIQLFGGGYIYYHEDPFSIEAYSTGQIARTLDGGENFTSISTNSIVTDFDMTTSIVGSAFGLHSLFSWSYPDACYSENNFSHHKTYNLFENVITFTADEALISAYQFNTDGISVGRNGVISRSSNNWSSLESNGLSAGNNLDITTHDNDIYVLANCETYDDYTNRMNLYKMYDNGWSRINDETIITLFTNVIDYPSQIKFIDEQKCIISSFQHDMIGSNFMISEDCGQTWDLYFTVEPHILDFEVVNDNELVGYSFDENKLYKIDITNHSCESILDLTINDYCLDNGTLYAVGNSNKVYKSDNYGDDWSECEITGLYNGALKIVKFQGNFGIVMTEGNYPCVTFDGGVSWTINEIWYEGADIKELFLLSPEVLYAIDYDKKLYKSSSYGKGWTLEDIEDSAKIEKVIRKDNKAIAIGEKGQYYENSIVFNEESQIAEALKYYPLNEGDIRRYIKISSISKDTAVEREEIVIGEPIVKPNGKLYFDNGGFFERVDSLTANVYRFDETDNQEYQIDSLLAEVSDDFRSRRFDMYWDFDEQKAQCYDVENMVYSGLDKKMKFYERKFIPVDDTECSHSLTKDIGLTNEIIAEENGYFFYNSKLLVYAKCDGIEYLPENRVNDFYMLNVGNKWEYKVFEEDSTLVSYQNVEVVSDSLSAVNHYMKIRTIEKDLNFNITSSEISYVLVDENFNLVGNIYSISNTESATIFSFQTEKFIGWHQVNQEVYCKFFGLTEKIYDNGNKRLSLSYALIDDVSYGYTDIAEDNIVSSFELFQNYPNPFNPTTTINFSLPNNADVKLTVFNINGSKIIEKNIRGISGVNSFNFDGNGLSSGQYFYRIDTKDFSRTRKMILLK
ncbi:MAG: T9SS type A sorting domain-containing protein [Candidatus Delongbacteria bacterium]|nr:T9SS type A sorting domain-containing protein [Candidatus Delongbacteria bacterium]MBN2836392.1 T9SS type A sorting domain-containing protein [Candidatus Delongbacteria bacterium]